MRIVMNSYSNVKLSKIILFYSIPLKSRRRTVCLKHYICKFKNNVCCDRGRLSCHPHTPPPPVSCMIAEASSQDLEALISLSQGKKMVFWMGPTCKSDNKIHLSDRWEKSTIHTKTLTDTRQMLSEVRYPPPPPPQ